MKIIVATLTGEPAAGDVVELHYMAPRGGRTTAGHVVALVEQPMGDGVFRRRPETVEEICAEIAKSAQIQYCGAKSGAPAFDPQARKNMVRVGCRDEVDDVTFAAEVKSWGGGTLTLEITEL